MIKKILAAVLGFLSITAVLTGVSLFNKSLSASQTAYTSGGEISGRVGDLQSRDKFYIFTNTYPFQTVSNDSDRGILALSDVAIGSITWTEKYGNPYASQSNYRDYVKSLNEAIDQRDVDKLLNRYSDRMTLGTNSVIRDLNNIPGDEQPYFIGTTFYYMYCGDLGVTGRNMAASINLEPFFIPDTWYGANLYDSNIYGPGIVTSNYKLGADAGKDSKRGVQPGILVKKDLIVFAVSQPEQAGNIASVNKDKHERMKLRLKNDSMNASINEIVNFKGTKITSTTANTTVTIKGSANAGSDADGNPYTVSLLVFDENDNFLYYKPLEPAKGTGDYVTDLTDIPEGDYKFAIVNEAYNETSVIPTDCSPLSDKVDFSITVPHQIAYTKHPASGASSGVDYEYSKNVNGGDTIGKITLNPIGAIPITYAIEADGDSTYQNFEISGLNSENASEATSLDVKIKQNAPDLIGGGLKAGEYKFCIISSDIYGYPQTQVEGKTKACTSFVVEKTDLSVAFDEANETKKSIDEAKTSWNETATGNPSTGTKVTYSVSGGDVSLITIDANTGAITYAGNNAFGKVKIKATIDDDPSSGLDNYNPAYTEKEIIIYRGVDGSVTPHNNSSSTTSPTFTTADSNIKMNGIIGTIKGTLGTPDTIGGTATTYRYGLKAGTGDADFFSVDANTGVIKTTVNLGIKTYTITVTVSDKWSTKEIPVTINVGMSAAENLKFYENSTSSTIINTKSVKVTDTNVTVYATVKGSTNTNPVTYKIKDGSTNVIEVNQNSGAITIHGVGTVTIVAEKQGASGQADASAELTFTVTAGAQNFIYTDSAGNELPKSGNNYTAKTDTYAPNKTFQLYTAGNPTGSNVTYQLKAGAPTDVISVDSSGLVTIVNATQTAQAGKVIVQATSHDPTGNYEDKTIELPINIDKGIRIISFAEDPIYVVSGKGQVVPVTEVDGVTDTDGDVLIEIDSNEDHTIAWTNDNKTIDYNYSGEEGKDIKIHATKPMNRNYKLAETDGTLHIMGPDESMLAITSPGQIIYGDHFTIRSTQFDADSTNVKYTFEVDKTTYISNPTVNGNSAEFDAIQSSGSNKTIVTVLRTADGEAPLSKKVQVTVLPKSIEIIIDDKEKLKGEQNPSLTYQDFKSQLVSWNGVQDRIQENDIKLNTTAKTESNAGAYPIKGDNNLLNQAYPNYSFTFKEGTLTIKEENIEDDWYHLELDDGNNTAYSGEWTNKDVNIISDHNEYIHLSLDQSTWNSMKTTVSKEGETNQSFWMKKDSGAITKEKQETIKIDKTVPKVKNIKAKDSNNKLQDIINKLTGGIFFRPGTSFEITTSDVNGDLKVSGTKEIAYKVYKTEKQSRAGDELIKEGTLKVTGEKANITISETSGSYRVCVTPTDNAGNANTETCHEAELKKIDIDVDGDGKPDFNDPDGDGCPDLNIKWKDPNTNKWIVINGDRDGDGIPDINIDSDGDGKPNLNIDTDNDGKPDLNLVILKKGDWKPTKCVKQDVNSGILEEYCTGTGVKAKLNVDTDDDGIPNINIDNKGDFKPHINISKDGQTPSINIAEIHEWKPKKDYKSDKFAYDSVGKNDIKPEINIDSDGDGRPDLNIDLDKDGKADINIDLNGDGIPDIDIDSDGDGKPDVNVDTDGDGKPNENIIEITEWKPNKNIDGDLPYDTMSFDKPDKEDDSSVKGQYNPVTSMGGANTGDNTNLVYNMGITLLSLSLLFLLTYKYKNDEKDSSM